MLKIFVVYAVTVAIFRPFFQDGFEKLWSLVLAIIPFIYLEYLLIQEAGSHIPLMIFYIIFAPIAVLIGEFVVDSW